MYRARRPEHTQSRSSNRSGGSTSGTHGSGSAPLRRIATSPARCVPVRYRVQLILLRRFTFPPRAHADDSRHARLAALRRTFLLRKGDRDWLDPFLFPARGGIAHGSHDVIHGWQCDLLAHSRMIEVVL